MGDDDLGPIQLLQRLHLLRGYFGRRGRLGILETLGKPLRVAELEEKPMLSDQKVGLGVGRNIDGEDLGRAEDGHARLCAKGRLHIEDPEFMPAGVGLRHGAPVPEGASEGEAASGQGRRKENRYSQELHSRQGSRLR